MVMLLTFETTYGDRFTIGFCHGRVTVSEVKKKIKKYLYLPSQHQTIKSNDRTLGDEEHIERNYHVWRQTFTLLFHGFPRSDLRSTVALYFRYKDTNVERSVFFHPSLVTKIAQLKLMVKCEQDGILRPYDDIELYYGNEEMNDGNCVGDYPVVDYGRVDIIKISASHPNLLNLK